MSEQGVGLAVAVCSIVATRRRKYFWAAWWSEAPSITPFRKPDASNGGASTEEEARWEAERVAGRALTVAPAYWARAWNRVLRGEAPFTPREIKASTSGGPKPAPREAPPKSASTVLGVEPGASTDAFRRAYKKRALETHPDRGGTAEAFRAVQQSYERLVARAKRPRAKKR